MDDKNMTPGLRWSLYNGGKIDGKPLSELSLEEFKQKITEALKKTKPRNFGTEIKHYTGCDPEIGNYSYWMVGSVMMGDAAFENMCANMEKQIREGK